MSFNNIEHLFKQSSSKLNFVDGLGLGNPRLIDPLIDNEDDEEDEEEEEDEEDEEEEE